MGEAQIRFIRRFRFEGEKYVPDPLGAQHLVPVPQNPADSLLAFEVGEQGKAIGWKLDPLRAIPILIPDRKGFAPTVQDVLSQIPEDLKGQTIFVEVHEAGMRQLKDMTGSKKQGSDWVTVATIYRSH